MEENYKYLRQSHFYLSIHGVHFTLIQDRYCQSGNVRATLMFTLFAVKVFGAKIETCECVLCTRVHLKNKSLKCEHKNE